MSRDLILAFISEIESVKDFDIELGFEYDEDSGFYFIYHNREKNKFSKREARIINSSFIKIFLNNNFSKYTFGYNENIKDYYETKAEVYFKENTQTNTKTFNEQSPILINLAKNPKTRTELMAS